jgi:PKHD-type hydroxylase
MSFWLSPPRNPVICRQLHNVLGNGEIANILSYTETQEVRDGRLGNGKVNPDIRRSKILFLPIDEHTKWLYNKIGKLISDVNQSAFNFAIDALQPIQYTEYHASEQGNYSDHLDWAANQVRPRKLSMSIQLTDEKEYVGGDLQLKIKSHDPIVASRTKGDALVFPSFLLHGVTPVTEGVRKSLVVWVDGPEWR